jgi:hypothetical protein
MRENEVCCGYSQSCESRSGLDLDSMVRIWNPDLGARKRRILRKES